MLSQVGFLGKQTLKRLVRRTFMRECPWLESALCKEAAWGKVRLGGRPVPGEPHLSQQSDMAGPGGGHGPSQMALCHCSSLRGLAALLAAGATSTSLKGNWVADITVPTTNVFFSSPLKKCRVLKTKDKNVVVQKWDLQL